MFFSSNIYCKAMDNVAVKVKAVEKIKQLLKTRGYEESVDNEYLKKCCKFMY